MYRFSRRYYAELRCFFKYGVIFKRGLSHVSSLPSLQHTRDNLEEMALLSVLRISFNCVARSECRSGSSTLFYRSCRKEMGMGTAECVGGRTFRVHTMAHMRYLIKQAMRSLVH